MSLSTTKSIADLQALAAGPTLRRALGPVHLTALGIGSVIGTGIFRKLENDPTHPHFIHTVRKIGYRLSPRA
ncbi:MAG: hypothetical protein ACREL3_09560 [Gemmatimonadales bacterium]